MKVQNFENESPYCHDYHVIIGEIMVQFLRKKNSKIKCMAFEFFSQNDPLLKVILHVPPLLVSDSDILGLHTSVSITKSEWTRRITEDYRAIHPGK